MEQVLLVFQVIIAAALIGIVLLQRSDTDGFGLGSGSGANFLSGRGAANLMTRTTAILATLFILNSLALSIIAAHSHAPSIVDAIEADTVKSTLPGGEKVPVKTPAVEKTIVPSVPDADAAPKVEAKKAKKAKPAIDADANMDTTGGESE